MMTLLISGQKGFSSSSTSSSQTHKGDSRSSVSFSKHHRMGCSSMSILNDLRIWGITDDQESNLKSSNFIRFMESFTQWVAKH